MKNMTWYPEDLPEDAASVAAAAELSELTRIRQTDPWATAALTSADQKALRWE